MASVDLHWIPVGAGGNGFVRRNAAAYERLSAWREHRAPLTLVHAAVSVELGGRHYVIEQAWPCPRGPGSERGVRVTGPVFFAGAGRLRALRYEVRCWEGGVIADLDHGIVPAQRVATGDDAVAAVVAQASRVPALTWGRRSQGHREMWNSNSAIAWILVTAGRKVRDIGAPAGCRAPGWDAGLQAR